MTTQIIKTTFKDLPFRDDLLQDSLKLAEVYKKYETLAVIGIGGSSVGPEALWKVLKTSDKNQRNLVFFDNTDFVDAQRKIDGLDLGKTAWYIVSKSGSTLETLATTEWVSEIYRKTGLSFYPHVAVCTEKRSNPLFDWAQAHQVPVLEIPLDVGGRFSVLSPVGLFPLAYAGIDVVELLNGAKKALEKKSEISALAEKCAASFSKKNITVFWFYSSMAKSFGSFIQQLWAESLGKKLNLKGMPAKPSSTPFFAVGASDQHSILQQVAEGMRDKFVIFFRSHQLENYSKTCDIKEFSSLNFLQGKSYGELICAAADGTEQALKSEGVQTAKIYYDDHSSASFGYLVMWFELLVVNIGEILELNPFDQPGVESSKKNTYAILKKKAWRN